MVIFPGEELPAEFLAEIGDELLVGTLVKVTAGTPTPGALTAGTNPTTANKACRCTVEEYSAFEMQNTSVSRNDRRILILAASIEDDAVPAPEDQFIVESVTYELVAVERDPAGVCYECQARGA